MEPHAGVEPASSAWQADIIAIIRMRHIKFKMEPHAGVEPASSAWQADIIAIIRMRPH